MVGRDGQVYHGGKDVYEQFAQSQQLESREKGS